MRARHLTRENLGTRSEPVWRYRTRVPLTTRAVRAQMLALPDWVPEDRVEEFLADRRAELASTRTELDTILTDEEADALERFAACEEARQGNARCPQWLAERVQASTSNYAPISDDQMQRLIAHARVKRAMPPHLVTVLQIFSAQQRAMPGAPSDAQAAMLLAIPGKHRRQAWHLAVKAAATHLVAHGY